MSNQKTPYHSRIRKHLTQSQPMKVMPNGTLSGLDLFAGMQPGARRAEGMSAWAGTLTSQTDINTSSRRHSCDDHGNLLCKGCPCLACLFPSHASCLPQQCPALRVFNTPCVSVLAHLKPLLCTGRVRQEIPGSLQVHRSLKHWLQRLLVAEP